MTEPDFEGLRHAVEAETYLPEFGEVRRRARRYRRRRMLLGIVRVLAVLALATPALVSGGILLNHLYAPADATTGGAAGTTGGGLAAGRDEPVTTGPKSRTIVAVGGIDINHTYALVDVCALGICDLELSAYAADTTGGAPQRTGLLRQEPSDPVTYERVSVINSTTVAVSGVVDSQPRQSVTVDVAPGRLSLPTTTRAVQDQMEGPIGAISGDSPTEDPLTAQPPLSSPVLARQENGWWVFGADSTGRVAVSVSRDDGGSWSTRSLPVAAGERPTDGPPLAALATINGHDVYVLVDAENTFALYASDDGGDTWTQDFLGQQWPTPGRIDDYGLVSTASNRLIAWFTDRGGHTTYFGGEPGEVMLQPLTGTAAPPGPVVAIDGGGYVTLGTNPSVSLDAINWQRVYVPYA